jgi:hypothetical protein
LLQILDLVVRSTANAAPPDDNFILSVGATICDPDPGETWRVACTFAAKIVVIVPLESGESIGSCTLRTFSNRYCEVALIVWSSALK